MTTHPGLFDTHCHVDLYPSPEAVIQRAESAGIYTIAVTNAPSVFEGTERLTAGSRFVRAALGLHPELAAERAAELPLMWDLLSRTRYVGEIGLDYVTGSMKERGLQRRVFEQIVTRCNDAGGKVLTIHSRRAESDVLDVLHGFRGAAILHWFSGPLKMLDRAVSQGLWISLNPAMTRARRFEEIAMRVPAERLLLESDGPFVRIGQRPAEPADTSSVVSCIADVWGVALDVAHARLAANFRRLILT